MVRRHAGRVAASVVVPLLGACSLLIDTSELGERAAAAGADASADGGAAQDSQVTSDATTIVAVGDDAGATDLAHIGFDIRVR